MSFHLTDKQKEGAALLGGLQRHTMFAGGSRSGKTFLFTLATATRGLKAPGSRHAILRFRFGHVKQSIIHDTFPRVMKEVYPNVAYTMNKSDWFATLPGGSEIWFGGLDDKERTEKILGTEFATIYFNECSQIPYHSRNMALTRLAQLVADHDGKPLSLRAYYDENPPDKGHWTYKLFRLKVDPETKNALPDPENYAYLQMNPVDNQENLNPDYLRQLQALSPRLRKRFLEGEFRDAVNDALFPEETLDKWRLLDGELPEMLRITVGVDPSGADDEDNADNDEIGISVSGLGIDGRGYVLEDLTCKAGPATWGRVAVDAYHRWRADRIVAEDNFGGAMVKHVIRSIDAKVPYRSVHASRGKVVRAEPVSSLFEQGKGRLAGIFRDLEDELTSFTSRGYVGDHSPNRADAMVWALYDLFPDLIKEAENPKGVEQIILPALHRPSKTSWMHNL